ncbi:hypothetical protein B0H19DRAFT_1140478, partial [Mycena capillaripes]
MFRALALPLFASAIRRSALLLHLSSIQSRPESRTGWCGSTEYLRDCPQPKVQKPKLCARQCGSTARIAPDCKLAPTRVWCGSTKHWARKCTEVVCHSC